MTESSIYGNYRDTLETVMHYLTDCIKTHSEEIRQKTGESAYEHLIFRIKSEESMREKCLRKGLPLTPRSALHEIHDAVGIRVVCCFLNDIYDIVNFIASLPHCRIVQQKDYIRSAKPNGYRSYHLIVEVETPGVYCGSVSAGAAEAGAGNRNRTLFRHLQQLRLHGDSAGECDLSMQTIRDLIHKEH